MQITENPTGKKIPGRDKRPQGGGNTLACEGKEITGLRKRLSAKQALVSVKRGGGGKNGGESENGNGKKGRVKNCREEVKEEAQTKGKPPPVVGKEVSAKDVEEEEGTTPLRCRKPRPFNNMRHNKEGSNLPAQGRPRIPSAKQIKKHQGKK